MPLTCPKNGSPYAFVLGQVHTYIHVNVLAGGKGRLQGSGRDDRHGRIAVCHPDAVRKCALSLVARIGVDAPQPVAPTIRRIIWAL